ncbi:DNA-3-methyladenine glycosylase family protein [Candidatus Neomarinimicrobiota bacterium]
MRLRIRLSSKGPTNLALCTQPVTENQADREAYANGVLYRASHLNGVPGIIQAKSVTEDKIEFTFTTFEDPRPPSRAKVEQALRRKFSLDLDLPAFYEFVSTIPELSHLPAQQRGLRPILKGSLLEALCLAIVDQQVNVTFAARLKHRLLETYGRKYNLNGQVLWLFPKPDTLARLEPHALRPLQFTGSKSRYIIGLARTFIDDPGWEAQSGTDEEIVSRLCSLHGVGKWTAEYAAMVGLGLVDTLPAADIGLMRMVQRVYQLPNRPTEKQVREIAQDWSPWRGLVTFYLWHQEDTET